MPKKKNATVNGVNFRLAPEVLADLDKIVVAKSKETGLPVNRTAVLRLLIRREAANVMWKK